MAAHERWNAERERQIGGRIAHQLPRDQCVLDFGFDLDARIAEAAAHALPHVTPAQHQAKQFPPHLGHALLDATGNSRLWVHRVDPVILQIPADILGVLRRKREGKRPRRGLARAIALPHRFYAGAGMFDAESRHRIF